MRLADYMLLPKERLAELLVEAEERYNALLPSTLSNRSGSTCSERISSVRREAALKRWKKQPMQNMQFAQAHNKNNDVIQCRNIPISMNALITHISKRSHKKRSQLHNKKCYNAPI